MGKYSKRNTQSPKKPITKKWWFWTLIVFVVVGVIGNLIGMGPDQQSGEDQLQTTPPPPIQATSGAETTITAEGVEPDATSALPFDVTFSSSFHNDKTGRWRKALVATSSPIDEYAVDYYKEYFKSDDEVHYIYNFTLNTVNALTVQDGTLFISVSEYVDGEEHDAAKAGGGEYYGQYHFDLDTGEMTFSSFS